MAKGWREKTDERPALLTELYASVLYPDRMGTALAGINRHLDCDGVHLVGWDERTAQPLVSVVTDNHIATAETAYLEHYATIDPRREMGRHTPHGQASACHDFFDDRFVARDEFYQDFLIPLGPRYIAGGSIYRSEGKQVHLVFNHLVGRPRFEGRKRQAIEAWLPQLTHWMDQVLKAEELRQTAAFGELAIEAMGCGVLFFDNGGRLLHANRQAVVLLGPHLNRVNLGQSGRPPHGSNLDALIEQVARSRRSAEVVLDFHLGKPGVTLTITAVSRDGSSGAAPGSVGRLASAPPQLPGLHHRASVVMTVNPAVQKRATPQDLIARWSLTPAEAALAKALLAGKSVAEHAAAKRIKVSTVRTHVRALLEKSGCRSMREWLSLAQRVDGDSR